MSRLLILGAGQYGRLVRELAVLCGYTEVAFLDDAAAAAIGKLSELDSFVSDYPEAIVAIGNPARREEQIQRLEALDFTIPVLLHPRAWVSSSAQVAPGCVIEANAVVNAGALIGRACLVCAGAVVNHNAQVGDICQIDCNAVVPPNAVVPSKTKVPAGTVYDHL
ncbi:MAG: hypothetical protein J6Y80_01530 [Victivallales bacterium]|nr:hypothetical protein [Victivallales bacterium]